MDEGILNIFRKIATARGTIRLLNVYQGIPIAYPATIVNIGSSSISVQTEKYQIVCLYRERETIVQHPEFPSVLKARVSSIDIPYLHATLTDLEYIRDGTGDRRQVRVWPKELITGGLQASDRSDIITGELADISLDGVGIYISEREFSSKVFHLGRKVAVNYRLTGTFQLTQPKKYDTPYGTDPSLRFDRSQLRLSSIHTPTPPETDHDKGASARTVRSPELEVQGLIANINPEAGSHRYRIGIRLLADEYYRTVIAQFISQRQSDIIQEINSLYKILIKEQ